MTGYPQSADYAFNKIDLLQREVEHLRTVNAELLAVVEAVLRRRLLTDPALLARALRAADDLHGSSDPAGFGLMPGGRE